MPTCRQGANRSARFVHLVILAALLLPLAPAWAQSPPSIVFAVIDDAGIEEWDFYDLRDELGPYAVTEFISDTLVPKGTIFTNAWSNPLCSPTRAAFHTGKYAFRTGIGDVILDDTTYGLDVDDPNLLPRLLASTTNGTTQYATGVFGKWHLGTSDGTCQGCAPDQGGENAPGEAGYLGFDALLFDQQPQPFDDYGSPYFEFCVTSDGSPDPVKVCFDAKIGEPGEDDSIYATHEVIDRAIAWIDEQEANGRTVFVYLPFFAAHGPWGCPRDSPTSPYPGETFECDGSTADTNDEQFRSMIETVSLELERVLAAVDGDPLVIVTVDNGTPSELTTDPFGSNQAKGTVGQGGVNVPLLVKGPGVQQGAEITHSVNLADLYATILDFAGKDSLIPNGVDSKSLEPLLTGANTDAPHDFNYSETFFPNFEPGTGFGPCTGEQAVQEDPGLHAGATYKYIRTFGSSLEALYDLDIDPFEGNNLISSPPDPDRLQALEDQIDLILQSDLESLCVGKAGTGEPCQVDSDCCSNDCSGGAVPACLCPM